MSRCKQGSCAGLHEEVLPANNYEDGGGHPGAYIFLLIIMCVSSLERTSHQWHYRM